MAGGRVFYLSGTATFCPPLASGKGVFVGTFVPPLVSGQGHMFSVNGVRGNLSPPPLVFLGGTHNFSRTVSGGTFCPSLVCGEEH